ncbi:hypothetical protein ASG22_07455 [Chryseobacterium sp. Leaf405]|uniref:hypothetical protein n=1 Tax=Chryseobacterium sp. Leaf405 TaxID=1736367 RepID=UPI0006FAECC1|nr:hypothetical protein [Chryseobacterium sp. Leaf405]KQT23854.1 hypothetical protein ASG22_07455 [Chryseobacterium sp. Leaf405]
MKRKILFFLLISCLSFSQQKSVKITDLQPKSEDFTFPKITYTEKPLVENKINTFLQVDQLEYIPGAEGTPSKLVSTGKTSYSNYVYFYSWEKLETPKNILSIAISGEASGAYPEGFDIWKNFDLRTGNFINAKDLFQPNSIKAVENLIQKSVKKEVNDFIVQLKAEKNPSEDTLAQISMYEDCFTDFTLDGIEYYFAKDKIRFIAGRCSNHAMRALDDLGSHVVEIPYKNLDKYWNSYAKNLLSSSEKVDSTNIHNKLYKGKIDGKYPITVLINTIYEDGSFSAKYWYDKNKKLIEWNGKLKGNHISVIENDYYSEETNQWIIKAYIEAEVKGDKIVGTWQDYQTKKYLKLELEEL